MCKNSPMETNQFESYFDDNWHSIAWPKSDAEEVSGSSDIS